ncbi:MAG: hypothetical protein GY856_52685 [bacterium]|nr:hypothetical protein [bacterium]
MNEPVDHAAPESRSTDSAPRGDRGGITPFSRSFVALVDQMREASPAHPTVDELIAYDTGELGAEEKDRLQDHLVICRDCFALIADLESFSEAGRSAPRPERPADFEAAAFWRTLRPRLATRRWHIPAAMAASFLVAALGFSFWVATQQRTIAELSEPQPNPRVYDLVADTSQRTGRVARPLEIPSGVGFTLIFTPDLGREYPGYQVMIRDSEDSVVRTVEGVEKRLADETFTLWLPPGALPLGEYRVELYGLEGEGSELIARYRMRMVGPERAPS